MAKRKNPHIKDKSEDRMGNQTRNKYSEDFKKEAIRLVKSGERTQKEISRNLGVSSATVSKWCSESQPSQAVLDLENSQEENRRLRSELERVRMERDILKKAATYFAKSLG